jgi:hypothetical protein
LPYVYVWQAAGGGEGGGVEAADLLGVNSTIRRMILETYDLIILYNKYTKSPCGWLAGLIEKITSPTPSLSVLSGWESTAGEVEVRRVRVAGEEEGGWWRAGEVESREKMASTSERARMVA